MQLNKVDKWLHLVMTEIEKMGKKIKKLEKERNDFRHRWDIAEQNVRKSTEDVKRKFVFLSN